MSRRRLLQALRRDGAIAVERRQRLEQAARAVHRASADRTSASSARSPRVGIAQQRRRLWIQQGRALLEIILANLDVELVEEPGRDRAPATEREIPPPHDRLEHERIPRPQVRDDGKSSRASQMAASKTASSFAFDAAPATTQSWHRGAIACESGVRAGVCERRLCARGAREHRHRAADGTRRSWALTGRRSPGTVLPIADREPTATVRIVRSRRAGPAGDRQPSPDASCARGHAPRAGDRTGRASSRDRPPS